MFGSYIRLFTAVWWLKLHLLCHYLVRSAKLGIVGWHQLSVGAVHNPLQKFHDLFCQLEITIVAPVECIPLTLVQTNNETLLPVGGICPSRMIAAVRSRIIEAPVSHTACTVSIFMPDGPGALPVFIWEIAFLTILMVFGMGGPSTGGSSYKWFGPSQTLW